MMNTTTTQSIRSTNKFPSHMSEDDASSSISALLNPEELSSSQKQQANKHQRQSLRIKSHEAPAKPKRKRISQEQFQALSELFEQTDTPNYELREKLALKLNMTNREVQVWFQNRRAKFNRVRLQEQRNQQLLLQQQKPIQRWQEDQHNNNNNSVLIYSTSSSTTTTTAYPHPQDHFYNNTNTNNDIHHHHDLNRSNITSTTTTTTTNNTNATKRRWNDNASTELPSLSYHEDSFSSTSSSSSSTPTSPYPTLSPDMAPLEILAMAADYVQRCDQEQEEAEQAAKKRRLMEEEEIHHHQQQQHNINTQKSWRPWL